MIYWRTGPDGTRLTIRWIESYRRWEVKREREAGWCESARLALALAAATDEPPEAPWIREIEAEIDRGVEPDLRDVGKG